MPAQHICSLVFHLLALDNQVQGPGRLDLKRMLK
jgi:hypothetical protein